MQFTVLVLFVCAFLFLYVLHLLSKDDFVFIRKDISMEQIFNTAIWTMLFSLFFARLSYAIINPGIIPETLLGFLAIPYFPGLYLAGAVLGGSFSYAIQASYKKLPVGRLFDFLILSFSIILPFCILLNGFILRAENLIFFLPLSIVYLFISVVFFKYLFPLTQRNVLKEGSLGIFYLMALSVVSFIANVISKWDQAGVFDKDNLLWTLILIISITIIVKQELTDKSVSKK